jgi:signal transduction histidine kinase
VTPAIQNAKSHEQALQLAESREQQALLEAKSLELERINEAKSQFLAMVSHELRTPLTSISAYTDLLERNKLGNLSDKQVRQLGVVKRNSAHLSRLISDLLDISKLESASFTLTKESFNLSSVLVDLAESFAPLIEKSEDTIHVDVEPDIEMVGDRQKITQVVSNLIENAVKYSSDGSDIKLKCSTSESILTIQVSDNGYGIPEEDQERIFETFVRSKTDENWEIPGTGLGLALVRRITTMHGGHIDLLSKPGVGSTFTLKFPRVGIETSAPKDLKAQMSSDEDAAEQHIQAYRQKMLEESNEQSDTAA